MRDYYEDSSDESFYFVVKLRETRENCVSRDSFHKNRISQNRPLNPPTEP